MQQVKPRMILVGMAVIVSLLFAAYLLHRIDLTVCLTLLRRARFRMVAGAIGVILFAIPCCGLRWYGVLASVSGKATYRSALRMTMTGMVLNTLVPAKAGDAAKILYVRRECGITSGFIMIMIERFLDLLVLGMISVLGGVLGGYGVGVAIGLLLIGGVLLIFTTAWFMAGFLRLQHDGWIGKAGRCCEIVHEWLSCPRLVLLSMAGSLGNWLMVTIAVGFLAYAILPTPPVLRLLAAYPVAILAGLLPVSISGMGVRETAFVHLLQDAIPPEAAALIGFGHTMLAYWVVALAALPFVACEVWRYGGEHVRLFMVPRYWRSILPVAAAACWMGFVVLMFFFYRNFITWPAKLYCALRMLFR